MVICIVQVILSSSVNSSWVHRRPLMNSVMAVSSCSKTEASTLLMVGAITLTWQSSSWAVAMVLEPNKPSSKAIGVMAFMAHWGKGRGMGVFIFLTVRKGQCAATIDFAPHWRGLTRQLPWSSIQNYQSYLDHERSLHGLSCVRSLLLCL